MTAAPEVRLNEHSASDRRQAPARAVRMRPYGLRLRVGVIVGVSLGLWLLIGFAVRSLF